MKNRGKIRITREMLEVLFGLPEDVNIMSLDYDKKREILSVIVRSDDEVGGYTVPTGEGQEIPDVSGAALEDGLKSSAIRGVQEMIDNGEISLNLER